LAAIADIVPSIINPLEYISNNFNGTINVLESMRLNNIKRIIYAASSSCYGVTKKIPTSEIEKIQTLYPYAFSKYIAEQAIIHWADVYKIEYISLRLFNVYGPRSRTKGAYGAVMGVFLKQKLLNKPFTIVGNGNQKRDFVYVGDVVDAIVRAGNYKKCNKIFNVGGGNPQKINDLVKLLNGKKTYIPKRPGEPDITFSDNTNIKKYLKWKPKVSLKDGVSILLKNINYWKDAPLWTPSKIKSATKEWFKFLS
jgi:UDP-glucose 4-epimerase